VVEQLINDVLGGSKAIDQAQNILLKRAQLQRQPALHQSLRAVVRVDVWPSGERKPPPKSSCEGHRFNPAAFLQTQFERVNIVIESVCLDFTIAEPN